MPRFPLLLLGIILAAYWGRVLRMALKARRRTGRAANIVPAEKSGRLIRILWLPIVIVWVAHPFILAFWRTPPTVLRPMVYSPRIAWPAAGIAGGCLALSVRCWKAMGRHWRMGIDPGEQNPLIAIGPFSLVRHPIYALSMLMMLASMAAILSPLMLGDGLLHIFLLAWESRREERHMLQIHGEAYSEYRRKVGAFVPKLR